MIWSHRLSSQWLLPRNNEISTPGTQQPGQTLPRDNILIIYSRKIIIVWTNLFGLSGRQSVVRQRLLTMPMLLQLTNVDAGKSENNYNFPTSMVHDKICTYIIHVITAYHPIVRSRGATLKFYKIVTNTFKHFSQCKCEPFRCFQTQSVSQLQRRGESSRPEWRTSTACCSLRPVSAPPAPCRTSPSSRTHSWWLSSPISGSRVSSTS